MIMPRGGKLLSVDESTLLASAGNPDQRQALIERLAAGLHASERRKDSRSHVGKRLGQRAKRK